MCYACYFAKHKIKVQKLLDKYQLSKGKVMEIVAEYNKNSEVWKDFFDSVSVEKQKMTIIKK